MTYARRPRDWLDNPILIKHVRSRLRRQPLGVAIVVALTLCICITWGAYQNRDFGVVGMFCALMALQGIILLFMGATQVGASVGAARASGVLDFHRVSPLTPTQLTLGFFFGAPIREYVLFACTLPFSLLCVTLGTPSMSGFIELMVLLVSSAWLSHGLTMLNALLARARANPRGVVGLVGFVVVIGSSIVTAVSEGLSNIDIDLRLPFYGISLPWLAIVVIYGTAALYFLYLAVRRRMTAERIHALSKRQAIAALATVSLLVVGSIWNQREYKALEVGALYVLVTTAIFLVVMVSPDRAEFETGLRRALKLGLAHLPWWDDLALNRVFLVIACATVLATATFASGGDAEGAMSASRSSEGSFPLAISAGVLVVAYFGLANQYFTLEFGNRGKIYFMLFLFLAWIVPLVAGMIVLLGSMSTGSDTERASQVVFCVSPVAGLAATALAGTGSPVAGIQAVAITPALLFTFVFNSLLISARRRVYRSFSSSKAGWPTS